MSIFRIFPDSLDTFTVNTTPSRIFTSSSAGVTGSVNVFVRKSRIEKDVDDPATGLSNLAPPNSDPNADKLKAALSATPDVISLAPSSVKKDAKSVIQRIVPYVASYSSSSLNASFIKKLIIKDTLQESYRDTMTSRDWAYVNYHSLNFFTASSVPNDSVLLFPNVSSSYELPDEMTFSFHINPRKKKETLKAGTIFHLSSSYAVSLITGSKKDENGNVTGFRIQLQLSHSADISPSVASLSTYPNDLVFLSDDNSLSWNNWHHVAIRWGTSTIDNGTGSFVIDGQVKGKFNIPSSTLMLPSSVLSPGALCVGNFYEGSNAAGNEMNRFFSTTPSTREGLFELNPTVGAEGPLGYSFTHPLNAEIHNLSIHDKFLLDSDVNSLKASGSAIITSDIHFYLPPFYVNSSSLRKDVITPALTASVKSASPFNTPLAFLADGHCINLENYLRDFATNRTPRLLNLSASVVSSPSSYSSANAALNTLPSLRKRNLTLLPCDDGTFRPSFELLSSESNTAKFVNDLGETDVSLVNVSELVSTSSTSYYENHQNFMDGKASSDFSMTSIGPTPTNFYAALGTDLTSVSVFDDDAKNYPTSIERDVADSSSNQIVIFDVSNMFYGKRILPGSLTITDSALSGSSGEVSVTLKDDEHGGLYRADSLTTSPSWSHVGSVFYEDGLIVIKNPHLFFFGIDGFTFTFKGDQSVHVMKLDALAPANHLNRSNNVQYNNLSQSEKDAIKPSGYANDSDDKFVYVTGINVHDENLNIVMKSKLAQPILKRVGDRIMFRLKLDF